MATLGAVLATILLLVAASDAASWLDAKTLTDWNVAGTTLPARPGGRDPDLAPGGRCATAVRRPTSPEDRAVADRGWALVGPDQRYGSLAVLMATASADGMCRPDGYQGFVFVNGVFAGTVSPKLMNARADASMNALSVTIYNSTDFAADFSRYGANDALCCPHAITSVSFTIRRRNGKPRVVLTGTTTTQKTPA
jgi:hypothetical protein